uniref:Uncharacterized protein n=1 Tax=Rhizophora mucronata TaxID=61149 RepID=A0A2P2M3K1_RHIMU
MNKEIMQGTKLDLMIVELLWHTS